MLSKYKYFSLSISFASYTSIFLALIPIIYVDNGFSDTQIAYLSSLYTFGAILQPIFAKLTSNYGIKKTLQFNFIVIIFCCFSLFFTNNFYIYFLLVTIYYIFQSPNIVLMDNFLKLISEQKGLSFGRLRSYISAGWGLGTIIALPFLYFFESKIILLLVTFIVGITYFIVRSISIKENSVNKEKNSKIDFSIFKNTEFLKVLTITVLLMGVWSIKTSYQTLLLIDKSSIVAIVSIVSVMSILVEVIIIPRVETLYNRLGYKQIVNIAFFAAMLLTFGYYFFQNPILIIFTALLHGVVCGIMIPVNVLKIRSTVKNSEFNSAMLIIYSLQNLFAFIAITFIVSKVYINFGVESVYLLLFFILSIGLLINNIIKYKNII